LPLRRKCAKSGVACNVFKLRSLSHIFRCFDKSSAQAKLNRTWALSVWVCRRLLGGIL